MGRIRVSEILDDRLCVVCGRSFSPKTRRSKCCGREECLEEMKRRRRRAYSKRQRAKIKKEKLKKICCVCGKSFETSYKRQKCCGSETCKKIMESNRKVRTNRERRKKAGRCKDGVEVRMVICSVCKTLFETTNLEKKTCSPACENIARAESFKKTMDKKNLECVFSDDPWEHIEFHPGCISQYDANFLPII